MLAAQPRSTPQPDGRYPPASSVHGILQQEYWSGCHLLSRGSKLGVPHCRQMLYCLSRRGSLLMGCLAHLHLVKLWHGLDLTYHLATRFLFTLSVDSFPSCFTTFIWINWLFLWVRLSLLLTSYLYFQSCCFSTHPNIILQIFVFYRQLCVVYLRWGQKEKGVAEDETVAMGSMYLWYIMTDIITYYNYNHMIYNYIL